MKNLKLVENLMGVERASRTMLMATALVPIVVVIFLPRQVALFIPKFLPGSKVFHVLVVIVQVLMGVPIPVLSIELPDWIEDEVEWGTGGVMPSLPGS